MPRYEIGEQRFRRKNLYMPCIINESFDDLSEEEQAQVFRDTWWADNVTNAEWPALLGDDDCSPSARSRLKKKATGWLMALQRMAALNPEMFREVVERSNTMYAEQIKAKPSVRFAWDGEQFDVKQAVWVEEDKATREVVLAIPIAWQPREPVAAPPQAVVEPAEDA